jgi:hypothetical protein
LLQAVNALMDYNLVWSSSCGSGGRLPGRRDIISVSAAIEASTVSRIFGITTAEATILDAATTTDLASN